MPLDISSLLSADEPTAQQKSQALIAALRQQTALGQLGQLTGDKVLGGFGQSIEGSAQHDADQLARVPMERASLAESRMQQANEQEKMVSAQRANATETDPGTVNLRRALAHKYAPEMGDAIDKAPAGSLPSALSSMEKYAQAQQAKYAFNPVDGSIFNTKNGQRNAGAGGQVAGLDDAAVDQGANLYIKTGTLPAVGNGAAGGALRRRILNRAAELSQGADIAGNKAGYHADTDSLASLQKSTDAVNSFERTAGKNLDNFLAYAKEPIDTGSPLLNKPLRAVDEKVFGSPKMAGFNVARQVAVNEIAKVLGGGSGGGALSDSARHEVEGLIGPDATFSQIIEASTILKRDMASRKQSMADEIAAIRGRIGGKPAAEAVTAPTTADARSVSAAQQGPATARIRYQGNLLEIPREHLADAIKDGAEEVK